MRDPLPFWGNQALLCRWMAVYLSSLLALQQFAPKRCSDTDPPWDPPWDLLRSAVSAVSNRYLILQAAQAAHQLHSIHEIRSMVLITSCWWLFLVLISVFIMRTAENPMPSAVMGFLTQDIGRMTSSVANDSGEKDDCRSERWSMSKSCLSNWWNRLKIEIFEMHLMFFSCSFKETI